MERQFVRQGDNIMVDPSKVSELVKVRFDDKGIPDGFIIECEFFKPRGKWYMTEDVVIPLDTKPYEVHDAIQRCRRVGEFVTVGEDLRGVPFLVQPD